jgi:hypothetical protein
MPRRSDHFRATESDRSNPYRTKSSGPFSKCGTLGSVRSAGKRGARFASCALLRFRAPARSAERPGRRAMDTKRLYELGMGENDRSALDPAGKGNVLSL